VFDFVLTLNIFSQLFYLIRVVSGEMAAWCTDRLFY